MSKWFVSLLVVFGSLMAFAQTEESSAPSSSEESASGGVRAPNFVDRGYMLPRGHFGLSLGVGVSGGTMKTENALLVEREVRTAGSEVSANLTYGLWDGLNLLVGTSYVPNNETENQTTLDKSKSKGMGDANVALAYRILNQSETMPVDMLLGFVYSPKNGVAKSATTTDNGNVTRGADAKAVLLGFYRRVSTGEFGLQVRHEMVGEAESEDATSGEKSKTDARSSTSISGTAQFEINEKYHIMAGAGVAQIAESKKTEELSGDFTKTDAYFTPVFSGGLRIIAVPQKAYVDFGISVVTAQDIEISSNTGASGKIKSLGMTTFSAGVNIEF